MVLLLPVVLAEPTMHPLLLDVVVHVLQNLVPAVTELSLEAILMDLVLYLHVLAVLDQTEEPLHTGAQSPTMQVLQSGVGGLVVPRPVPATMEPSLEAIRMVPAL